MSVILKRPPRLAMRLTPHDKHTLALIRQHTLCHDSDSEAVRNALSLACLVTDPSSGRFVLRNGGLRLQEAVWPQVVPPLAREGPRTERTLDVPLDQDTQGALEKLLHSGRIGTEKSQVVRSALAFYWDVAKRMRSGWRFGVATIGKGFEEKTVPGLPSGSATLPPNPLVQAALDYLGGEASKTAVHLRRRFRRLLAEVANRTRASAATLFLLEDGEIVPLEVYNVTRNLSRIDLHGQGIVPQVVRVGRAYYTNNVDTDRYYRKDNPETRSEIAVPILIAGKVIGCLNLESQVRGAFSPLEVEYAEEAASQLVPDLIIHLKLSDDGGVPCPWHPDLHGWDLEAIYEGVCFAITDYIDSEHSHAVVWYCDPVKQELFLYATTGYGADFRYDRTLPLSSTTGRIALGPPGTVEEIDPQNDLQFLHGERVRRLGISHILVTAVSSAREQRNLGTLHVYLNRADLDTPILREGLPEIAEVLGGVADRFVSRRQAVCAARLCHDLRVPPPGCASDFDAIRNLFRLVFAAPGVTLLGCPPGRHHLEAVSTTGLTRAASWLQSGERPSACGPEGPLYDLVEDDGITVYMGRHPGVCISKNNVLNPEEPGLPDDFPRTPLFRYIEDFPPHYLDHRRLLAGSVGVVGEEYAAGVIRCVRPGRSKPFTRCDEGLLKAMLPLCTPSFLAWRRSLADTRLPHPQAADRPGLKGAKEDLFRPFPPTRSNATLTDQLLRWLFLWSKQQGHAVRWVSLLLRHTSADGDHFRLKAFFSDAHRLPPVDTQDRFLPELIAEPRLAWDRLLKGEEVVSFDCACGPAVAGLRVPLTAWSGSALVQGVLSLDCADKTEWTINDVDLVYHAGWRLASIWNMAVPATTAAPVLNPQFTKIEPGRLIFEAFPSEIQERHGLAECSLFLRDGGSYVPDVPDAWPDIDTWQGTAKAQFRSPWKDLRIFGVKGRENREAVAIPLRLGATVVGVLRCVGKALSVPEAVTELVQSVTSLWTSITFGQSPYRVLRFEAHEALQELRASESSPRCSVKRWLIQFSGVSQARKPGGRGPRLPSLLIDTFRPAFAVSVNDGE